MPSNGSNRPRTRRHASPTPIVAPNTARPTTTVSRPLSTMPASTVVRAPPALDSSKLTMDEPESDVGSEPST